MAATIFSESKIDEGLNQMHLRIRSLAAPVFAILALVYYSINTYFFPHGISAMLIFGIAAVPYIALTSSTFRWLVFYLLVLFFIKSGSDIDIQFFARSGLLFLSFAALFFALSAFLKSQISIEKWIIGLSTFNIGLLICFLILWFTPWKDVVWWRFFLSTSVGDFTRLRGLSYEPSYYSLTLVPLVLYHISRLLMDAFSWIHFWLLCGLLMALALSFSLGVWLGLVLCLGIAVFYFLANPLFYKRNRFPILVSLLVGALLVVVIMVFFPGNALLVRMQDLIQGKDISGNSRLYDSFILCLQILGVNDAFFGLGPGQLKLKAYDTIKEFYHYTYQDRWSPAMPNSVTDWLCTFGVIGLAVKLFAEVRMFLKTRTFSDFFRFSCFIFIFIYQFTGGYLFCLPELVLWCLAFHAPDINRNPDLI